MRRGGIADITYVADWDGKGRSNDEEADVRSQWIDKATGKVINLSNYSFSEMSGWGGYQFDWSVNWHTDYDEQMTSVEIGKTKAVFSGFEDIPATHITVLYNTTANIPAGTTVRIKGIGLRPSENFYCIDYETLATYRHNGDGILEFTTPNDIRYLRITVNLNSKIDRTITLEQLPLYPGALVSDGVDDYGETVDMLTESVGTALVCAELLEDLSDSGKYILNAGAISTDGRIYLWRPGGSGYYSIGKPPQSYNQPPFILSRTPSSPNDRLTIGGASINSLTKNAISRIVLIKEQLDAAQLEFLKWKIGKEYRDWCKENGYEYAIDEM